MIGYMGEPRASRAEIRDKLAARVAAAVDSPRVRAAVWQNAHDAARWDSGLVGEPLQPAALVRDVVTVSGQAAGSLPEAGAEAGAAGGRRHWPWLRRGQRLGFGRHCAILPRRSEKS
jgi:hypothetical protein